MGKKKTGVFNRRGKGVQPDPPVCKKGEKWGRESPKSFLKKEKRENLPGKKGGPPGGGNSLTKRTKTRRHSA